MTTVVRLNWDKLIGQVEALLISGLIWLFIGLIVNSTAPPDRWWLGVSTGVFSVGVASIIGSAIWLFLKSLEYSDSSKQTVDEGGV